MLLVTYTVLLPEKTFQGYIQKLTDLIEKALGTDPGNITNRVIIFLFVKILYDQDIQR